MKKVTLILLISSFAFSCAVKSSSNIKTDPFYDSFFKTTRLIMTKEEMLEKDIEIYELNITEEMEAAQKYMVMGVPTVIVFKNGKELKRFNSVPNKKKVLKLFN